MAYEIDPKAEHDDLANPLEQYAGELQAVEQQIIGPFYRQTRGRDVALGGVIKRDCGDQRQGLRRRVIAAQADEAADVEIAGRRGPIAAAPSAPGGLAFGAQPQAFGVAGGGELGDGIVGRAGFGERDVADRRCGRGNQNSARAAAIVVAVSAGMAR